MTNITKTQLMEEFKLSENNLIYISDPQLPEFDEDGYRIRPIIYITEDTPENRAAMSAPLKIGDIPDPIIGGVSVRLEFYKTQPLKLSDFADSHIFSYFILQAKNFKQKEVSKETKKTFKRRISL